MFPEFLQVRDVYDRSFFLPWKLAKQIAIEKISMRKVGWRNWTHRARLFRVIAFLVRSLFGHRDVSVAQGARRRRKCLLCEAEFYNCRSCFNEFDWQFGRFNVADLNGCEIYFFRLLRSVVFGCELCGNCVFRDFRWIRWREDPRGWLLDRLYPV